MQYPTILHIYDTLSSKNTIDHLLYINLDRYIDLYK